MAEDLLTRIQWELQERIEELHGAIEERDRLQADLRALDAAPPQPFDPEPLAMRDVDPEPPLHPELPAVADIDPEPPALDPAPEPSIVADVDPESSAAVFCFPARSEPARTHSVSPQAGQMPPTASRPARQRVVSPKVARLMLAPRRPALERSGISRVGGRADRAAVSPEDLVDELDPEAELYERSM
jgi:hypothetical protein